MAKRPASLQSVERAFRVLDSIGRLGKPASLSEIASEAGIDKSTAQRMVNTLLELGYLERNGTRVGYMPGRRVLALAYNYLRNTPIVERATPVLLELRRNARERVDLSLFDENTIVYAVRLQSKRENFPATLVGRRIPAYASTGGRAMMSLMQPAQVQAILDASEMKPITAKTVYDREGVLREIEKARELGYALAAEESLPGEVVLAAAVNDAAGEPVAAVHIAGSLSEWTVENFRARFSPLAMEAAQALSNR